MQCKEDLRPRAMFLLEWGAAFGKLLPIPNLARLCPSHPNPHCISNSSFIPTTSPGVSILGGMECFRMPIRTLKLGCLTACRCLPCLEILE
mmetsp:Transcript_11492/g.28950  ORF Transcript_11492/g.28950 Transcript_11492/m.28950 type:complete len:91 (-) Transcript_11492:1994-2266(-)